MIHRVLGVAMVAVLALCGRAWAQPFHVRAWYAEGQVFVVWQMAAAPAAPTDTVEIYASPSVQNSVANMSRVGRLFFPEYTGARLTALVPGARLLVPTPGGGTYRLAVDEGVFAYTPRAAGNLFFAVVNAGSAAVNAGNSAAAAFNYDPVNEPVRPHWQFGGATPGGHPYAAYVVWAEGRDDFDNARPDVPVLADADKNGVPHVFTITDPIGGAGAGPMPCLVALHGGGGEYQLFRPGIAARANMSLGLTSGIVLTPDDSVYARVGNTLERSNTSWFGYTPEFDPFFAGARVSPGDTAVVVNFTSRRVFWILDWLSGPGSPRVIDPRRVAIVGHSGGGRGTSVITRQQPERFCAAVCYTPASDLSMESAGRENYLRGTWEQNLATNIIGPTGIALGTTEVFTMTTRLSATTRDFPLTRVFYGKRDEEGAASWTPAQRAVCDAFNSSRMGFMVFWDEREHGVEKWDTEENDATDDPAHTNPWPDVGQWVAPVRTERSAGRSLLAAYTNELSYPGFFNVDADAALAGLQPDPGPGDPDLGDAYGTWGGYLDWETASLTDEEGRWACTAFATGLSAVSIDNSPFGSFTADLVPRRTRNFVPQTGKLVKWQVHDAATQTLLQSGTAIAEEEGVVQVSGVQIPRDPARVRISLGACGSDYNSSGEVTVQDIYDFLSAWSVGDAAADFNGVNGLTVQDIYDFLEAWNRGC